MKPAWWAGCALAALVLATGVLQARERWHPMPPVAEPADDLIGGPLLARLALGFDAVAADLYWIRAVQHYGRERRSLRYEGRYRRLQPLIEAATTLDPHFVMAYQFGALLLAEPLPNGPGQLEAAIRLLEKGLRADPHRWQYAQYLGFIHYWHSGDRLEAARQFSRAAAMPGAPIWLQPLAADMFADGGDRAAARAVLDALVESDQPWMRELAQRKLRELEPR